MNKLASVLIWGVLAAVGDVLPVFAGKCVQGLDMADSPRCSAESRLHLPPARSV